MSIDDILPLDSDFDGKLFEENLRWELKNQGWRDKNCGMEINFRDLYGLEKTSRIYFLRKGTDNECVYYNYYIGLNPDDNSVAYFEDIPTDLYPHIRISKMTADETKEMKNKILDVMLNRNGNHFWNDPADGYQYFESWDLFLDVLDSTEYLTDDQYEKIEEMILEDDDYIDFYDYYSLKEKIYKCCELKGGNFDKLNKNIVLSYDEYNLPNYILKKAQECVFGEYPDMHFAPFYELFEDYAKETILELYSDEIEETQARRIIEDMFFKNNDLFGIMSFSYNDKDMLRDCLLEYLMIHESPGISLCKKFIRRLFALSDNSERKSFANAISDETIKPACKFCTSCCKDCINKLLEDAAKGINDGNEEFDINNEEFDINMEEDLYERRIY
jgi:hypothetical protein